MLRAIALALTLMLSLGAIIPLATDYTEAGPKKQQAKKRKKLKKYSKAWWRAYRARQNRRKTLAARKRALQQRQEMLAKQYSDGNESPNASDGARRVSASMKENSAQALLPSGEAAPNSWKRSADGKGELQYRVDDESGRQIGSAQLSVVGPTMGTDVDNGGRNKTLGGVSTSALRRTVIDRMMKEEGWVVNDYQQEVDGKKIFVVVAQSKGANNQIQSRMFYFTEVEGKIYSLSTNAPSESSERLARESERVINSLQRRGRSTQAELR